MTDERDDTLELIIRKLENEGRAAAWARAARAEIEAAPVGDPTPPPGSLLMEPPPELLSEPVHHGLSDTPEGGFYAPKSYLMPGRHYSVSDLRQKISRLQLWVTGLTMSFVSLLVVLWVRW